MACRTCGAGESLDSSRHRQPWQANRCMMKKRHVYWEFDMFSAAGAQRETVKRDCFDMVNSQKKVNEV
jgi:hypothetical protein